ncbi:family 16 glycosylhydrolase [Microvirga antarctica]|uniref:family 16 glycosylhydrolase n=1 Tax=Microvirga antarctica TaxID=2819233 RepID=UPI001B300251|nr:family 16 glycosylhydrolase [Microvirga antarctica]
MPMLVAETKTLFSDNFSANGKIDSSKWSFNEYAKGGSFYGNTQQRQELPSASDGVMHLRLDTYNPSDPKGKTFFGSEAITKQLFSTGGAGIAFEAKARFVDDQRGIIGGFFTFAGPPDTHDEIDFEALSNSNTKIQTNIYHREPLGEGHPESFPLSDSLTSFHTYRIEWLPNAVRWLVDGTVVRTETGRVPDKAMALHFNIWGPPASWLTGDASLVPVGNKAQNKSFLFDVTSVKVEQLSSAIGGDAAETLRGTGNNDWLDGGGGHDRLFGGNGNDTLSGGSDVDTLGAGSSDASFARAASPSGAAGNDRLIGGNGADKLIGGRGADSFVYTSLKDSTVAKTGRDSIWDFSAKQGDKVDLSALDANTGRDGNQAFSFIGKSAFHQKAGELRYDKISAQNSIVYGDVNGDGVADFAIHVKGSLAIAKGYFIL